MGKLDRDRVPDETRGDASLLRKNALVIGPPLDPRKFARVQDADTVTINEHELSPALCGEGRGEIGLRSKTRFGDIVQNAPGLT